MTDTATTLFPELVRPLRCPVGETEESILVYLRAFELDGAPSSELANYLHEDLRRFLYTLDLVPDKAAGGELLEIGANPYFTSILLRRFTAYRLSLVNYFGPAARDGMQVQRHARTGEAHEFAYRNINVESEPLDFDKTFDVVLMCEVIEHLQHDPVGALLNIKARLRDQGTLILTTPNVCRLENVSRLLSGVNLYDPYSGYGPYGRHNREYNKHELFLLLTHCGFDIELMFSSDVHRNTCDDFYPVASYAELIRNFQHRALDLGQYLFVRARNARPAKPGKPAWLYRSYPASELAAD